MNTLLLLTSIIGFAPALAIIWFSLRKYDHPYVQGACFDDRRVFFLLAIGMVMGSVLYVIERMVYPLFMLSDGTQEFFEPVIFILVYVIGMGMVLTLSKFIVLNFPAIQGRIDSPFYGVSLGAGISATWIVGFGYISLMDSDYTSDVPVIAALIIFSLNTALINSSVGAILGASTARNEGMRGILGGLVPHIVFNLLMLPWFYLNNIWYTLAIVTPLSVLIFWEVHTRIIPNSLPEEIQDEIRKNEKKAKKKGK